MSTAGGSLLDRADDEQRPEGEETEVPAERRAEVVTNVVHPEQVVVG